MSNVRLKLLAPLASVMIMILGAGALTTLTTLTLKELHVVRSMIGAVSSGYFVGLVAGAYFNQSLILRVGHIRAFCVFAAVMSATTITQGIFKDAWVWMLLRFILGYSLAGILVITESWLLALSQADNRGSTLSLYMGAYYAAQAFGQLLLNVPQQNQLTLFGVIASLISLSVLPVAITRFHAPSPESPQVFSLKYLYKKAPVGVTGALVGGLMLGAIYSLYPLFLAKTGKNVHEISYTMMATIFGGTLLQYPFGKISDGVDRRKVLFFICLLGIATFTAVTLMHPSTYALIVWSFIMGGTSFTLYPISISHTIDYLSAEEIMPATGLLLLVFGIGTIFSPLIEPIFSLLLGDYGFFIYLATAASILMLFAIWRIFSLRSLSSEEKSEFVALPRTTPNVTQLDPAVSEETPPKEPEETRQGT